MNPRLAVWVVNGLLAGLAAVSLFPLLWMLSVSLMPAGAASTLPPPLLPPAFTLDNYRDAVRQHRHGPLRVQQPARSRCWRR